MTRPLVILIAFCVAAGCGSSGGKSAKRPATTGPAGITYTDPCASRLHDLCGPLLLYYAMHQKLPADAEELRHIEGFADLPELRCPVSTRPYIYRRNGLVTPGGGGRVILYDPASVHDGKRWAIAIQETSNPNEPLIAKVISLPESFFSK